MTIVDDSVIVLSRVCAQYLRIFGEISNLTFLICLVLFIINTLFIFVINCSTVVIKIVCLKMSDVMLGGKFQCKNLSKMYSIQEKGK